MENTEGISNASEGTVTSRCPCPCGLGFRLLECDAGGGLPRVVAVVHGRRIKTYGPPPLDIPSAMLLIEGP